MPGHSQSNNPAAGTLVPVLGHWLGSSYSMHIAASGDGIWDGVGRRQIRCHKGGHNVHCSSRGGGVGVEGEMLVWCLWAPALG